LSITAVLCGQQVTQDCPTLLLGKNYNLNGFFHSGPAAPIIQNCCGVTTPPAAGTTSACDKAFTVTFPHNPSFINRLANFVVAAPVVAAPVVVAPVAAAPAATVTTTTPAATTTSTTPAATTATTPAAAAAGTVTVAHAGSTPQQRVLSMSTANDSQVQAFSGSVGYVVLVVCLAVLAGFFCGLTVLLTYQRLQQRNVAAPAKALATN